MSKSPGTIIDDHLIQLVDERIHNALARTMQARPKEYTSVARPPGMSRRAFVELCRRLARAGEHGVRHVGSLWVADFEVFERQSSRRRVSEFGIGSVIFVGEDRPASGG